MDVFSMVPVRSYLLWYFWKKPIDPEARKRPILKMSYLHPSLAGLKPTLHTNA
jgi:hypothetical protein